MYRLKPPRGGGVTLASPSSGVMPAILGTFFFAAVAFSGAGQDLTLSMHPQAWVRQVRVPEGTPENLTVRMQAGAVCGSEPCLAIGPWKTSGSGARLLYDDTLPFLEATLRGRYRTEKLYPRQAAVRVEFLADGRAVAARSFSLPSAAEWRDFDFPVYGAPGGADSIRVSYGLTEPAEGVVWFARLRVSEGCTKPAFPQTPPALRRPQPPAKLSPARYVRIARHNGAWWFVTPEGRAFFSLGTDALLGPAGSTDQDRQVYQLMRGLGFNSLAGWHSVARWLEVNAGAVALGDPPLWQMRSLETRVGDEFDTVLDATGANPGAPAAVAAQRGGFNHAFPDPYDPRWEAAVRRQVKSLAELVRDKPWFAVWFADNEREHRDLYRYVWARNSARAFGDFLRRRYGSIGRLNRAWRTRFGSFQELLGARPEPKLRHGAMYEDFRAFSRQLLRRYNDTRLEVIRQEDPGRLVFSNRFMIGEIRDVVENLDLYAGFDGLCVKIYPANVQPGLGAAEIDLLKLMHQRSGKPILIGEWSVPALDSGLYDNPRALDWSYPQAVETQTDRARQAAVILAELYNLPFVVGAHWFTWRDFDSPVRRANRGLFRASGEPWPELQNALSRIQAAINARSLPRP